jgi:HAD superfamily hydrolase (TIGR01490 family)
MMAMAEAVPPRSQVVVAAFDLDGTLTNGGSVFDWLRAICGTKATYEAAIRLGPALSMAAIKGGKAADMTKEDLFSELLRGKDLEEVEAISKAYAAKHLAKTLRTDAKARLDYHLAAGHHTVIVSASPELYVKEVARMLGVEGSVATKLAVDAQSKLTGRYEGKNCRGTEKFSRVTVWMRSQSLLGSSEQAPYLWAYGNSRGDRRLLEAADRGVSCARLGRLSRLRGYPTLADVVAETVIAPSA